MKLIHDNPKESTIIIDGKEYTILKDIGYITLIDPDGERLVIYLS